MRLLFLTEAFPNTSETFILHQMLGLDERGHDIWVCATAPLSDAPVHDEARRAD